MKRRLSDNIPSATKDKKQRHCVATVAAATHTLAEAFDILYETTRQKWQLLYEILNALEIPRDIGIVITRFILLYNCLECTSLVQCPPFASVCIPCHRENHNTSILCQLCVSYVADQCYSCDYTVCRKHSSFNTDNVVRCDWCAVLICHRCQDNPRFRNVTCYDTMDYDATRFDLCGHCRDLHVV